MKKKLKLITKIKERIKVLLYVQNSASIIDKIKNSSVKRLFIIGSPIHGNLGDHAIIEAELKFINDLELDYKIVEIPTCLYNVYSNQIYKNLNKDDIIIISGGGWLGDLWIHNEVMVREIISNTHENKVVIFPQTMFFTDTTNGTIERKISQKIYSEHPNLYFFVREKNSYEYAKKHNFVQDGEKLFLVPDIVLYTKLKQNTIKNANVLLCFRKDIESVKSREKSIGEFLKQNKHDFDITDTVLPHNIKLNERTKYLNEKYNEFSKYSMVITDRLHGMIFAAITGTKCIAFDNKTKKVEGVYTWIKNLKNINFVKDDEEFKKIFLKLLNQPSENYDENVLDANYDSIRTVLRGEENVRI